MIEPFGAYNGVPDMSLMNKIGQQLKTTAIVLKLNEALNIKDTFLNIPGFFDEIIAADRNSSDGTRDEILRFRKRRNDPWK